MSCGSSFSDKVNQGGRKGKRDALVFAVADNISRGLVRAVGRVSEGDVELLGVCAVVVGANFLQGRDGACQNIVQVGDVEDADLVVLDRVVAVEVGEPRFVLGVIVAVNNHGVFQSLRKETRRWCVSE